MNSKIALHVGFSKTGTTTLQRHLFSGHSQIRYLGKPYKDETLKARVHELLTQESLVYDPANIKTYLEHEVFGKTGEAGKLMLLSEEMLVSYSKVRDKGLVAQRLKDLFPGAKVLITIRNQFEILKAAYLSRGRLLAYAPGRYAGLHVKFDEWLRASYENIERSYLGHVDYFKTVEYYSRLFGRENLCVLPLEEFIRDPEEYIKKLTRFFGIDFSEAMGLVTDKHANRGISQFQLEAEALRSKWFPLNRFFMIAGMLNIYLFLKKNVRKDKDADILIADKWHDRFAAIYREGNRKLEALYGLPLTEYGYP